MRKNIRSLPKGKKGGTINTLVFGIGSLLLGIIVIYIIISTMLNANLLTEDKTSVAATNETVGPVNDSVAVSFGSGTLRQAVCTINAVTNASSGTVIAAGNYTQTGCTIIYSGVGDFNNTQWNITSSTTYSLGTGTNVTAHALADNLTAGVNNVSSKVPILFTVAVIVLLLGVFVLLLLQYRNMKLDEGGSSL